MADFFPLRLMFADSWQHYFEFVQIALIRPLTGHSEAEQFLLFFYPTWGFCKTGYIFQKKMKGAEQNLT